MIDNGMRHPAISLLAALLPALSSMAYAADTSSSNIESSIPMAPSVSLKPLPSALEEKRSAAALLDQQGHIQPALEALPSPKSSAPAEQPQPQDQPKVQNPPPAAPAKRPAAPSKTKRSTSLSAQAQAQDQAAPPAPSTPASDERALYDERIKAIYTAADEGRKDEALRLMKGSWEMIVRMEDFGTMIKLAYIAMELKDEATAVMAARKAVELADEEEFYATLLDVLFFFNRMDDVDAVLKQMPAKSPVRQKAAVRLAVYKAQQAFDRGNYAEAESLLLENHAQLDAGSLELLGWIQYRLGKLDEAAQQFWAAYVRAPKLSAAQGLVFSLHRLKRYEELIQKAQSKGGPLADLLPAEVQAAVQEGRTRFTIGPDATLALATHAGGGGAQGLSIKPEFNVRQKAGTAGEGRLTQTTSAITLRWQGEQDDLSLRLERQRLDDHVDERTGQGFYALWQHQGEDGLGYRLGLGQAATGSVSDGAATSPAWLGEAGISYNTEGWGLGISLFRRPITESLLALSGKRSTDGLLRWGRVVQTGVALDGHRQLGDWDALFSFTAASLRGENVADNRKYELYTRALRPITAVPGLAVGPELYMSHFQRNLSAFSFGHGGYFSPHLYTQLGGLALYETRVQQLELKVLAGAGYSWKRQEAAPYNPLTGEGPGYYAASNDQSLVYKAQLDGTWPIFHNWRLGFSLGAQKSTGYSDRHIGFFVEAPLASH